MPRSDQGLDARRYAVIPRTLIFVRRGDRYLLLHGSASKRLWAEKLNGIGGHIEPGEDCLAAARRELLEEAGLALDLWLCGTILVDTGSNPGVCLFVFLGECDQAQAAASPEGATAWIPLDDLGEYPVVEDLPAILARVHRMHRGQDPFSARSYYDRRDRLVLRFDAQSG